LLDTNEIITSEVLSFETLLSVKTIRKRIRNLNEVLIKHGAKINRKQGTGINLEIFDAPGFHKFRRENMENSYRIQYQNNVISELIDLLVSQSDYVKAEYLAEVLYISKTKPTQSLKDIRTILSYYDLSLESRPYYGLKIVGSEFNFRRFLTSNYVQKYQFRENEAEIYLPQIETEEKRHYQKLRDGIKGIVEEQLHKQNYSMASNLIDNLIDRLVITVIRIKKGMYMDTGSTIIYSEEDQEEYQLAEKIVGKIET